MKQSQLSKLILGMLAIPLAACSGDFNGAQNPAEFSSHLAAVSMAATTVNPNAIFVAPDGNDSNPGTMAQPLRTISRALMKAGTSGEVIVRAGTYKERLIGTRSRPASTMRSLPSARPTRTSRSSRWAALTFGKG